EGEGEGDGEFEPGSNSLPPASVQPPSLPEDREIVVRGTPKVAQRRQCAKVMIGGVGCTDDGPMVAVVGYSRGRGKKKIELLDCSCNTER
ncbi:hypothetical protein U1Q18_012556, partial [Sarracenia purpurea var. burkii]